MAAVAWFEMLVGLAILGLWAFLLATGKVPEVARGDRAIWFHIGAETLLGVALLCAGLLLLLDDASWSRGLAAAAAGGLAYSTVNSPGYYANEGRWGLVAVFASLAVLAMGSIVAVVVL